MEENKTYVIQEDTINYVYLIHDIPPEIKAKIACRRLKFNETRGRKKIKCPFCGEELLYVDKEIKVELFRLPARKPVKCHKHETCEACDNKVGLNFVFM